MKATVGSVLQVQPNMMNDPIHKPRPLPLTALFFYCGSVSAAGM